MPTPPPGSSPYLRTGVYGPRRAYTLIELFLTLAVLMILLGLMMNLSNRLRRDSTDRLARQTLARLTVLMNQYQERYGSLPPVQSIADGFSAATSQEDTLLILARRNNADFVRYLNIPTLAKSGKISDDPLASSLIETGPDAGVMADPWGTPIVFMPQQHPRIGMAPGDASFFFSAGPDRQYLTREDNVYGYEGN